MWSITLLEIILIVFGFCWSTVSCRQLAFVTEPQSTTVIEGSSVILQCKIIEGYSDRPVYWEIKGNVLTPDTTQTHRYKWLEDKEKGIRNLKILNASKDDEGTYICFIHFIENPNLNERSRPGTLTVIQLPRFIGEPQNKTTIEGGNVTLNCHVRNVTQTKFDVFWTRNGARIPLKTNFTHMNALPDGNERLRYTIPNQGKGNFNLHIANMSVEDAGYFRCVISIENGIDHILESRPATLNVVRSNCYIDDPKPKTDTYMVGDNITTVCSVQGSRADFGMMMISLSWSPSAASSQATRLQGDRYEIQRTWFLSANDDNKSVLCRIKLPGTSWETSCSIGPISVHTFPVKAITTSATLGTDGPSSTFLIVACFLLVILVIVVLVLGVIYRITRRNRLKVRQNKTDDMNLTETPRQQQLDEIAGRQNAAFSDLADARAINADMNTGNSPESHGQGHSVKDIISTNDRQGEATYAQVDKRRKREKNLMPVDIDIEATDTHRNEPVASRMILKSGDQESDRLCGKSEPTRRTDGLVYAELDIATSPTSNQRLVKVSEPPTIYADLKHPENKD